MPRKKPPTDNPATARILAAAGTMIARYGYAEATFDKIAKQAGVSRGLLHYHFRTKEQMLAQVLTRNLREATAMLREVLAQANSADELATRMVDTLSRLHSENPSYFATYIEGLGTARQSRVVRKEFSRRYREFRATLRDGLRNMIERGAIAPSLPAPTIAILFMSILDGLSLSLATAAGDDLGDDVWTHLRYGLRVWLK